MLVRNPQCRTECPCQHHREIAWARAGQGRGRRSNTAGATTAKSWCSPPTGARDQTGGARRRDADSR
eukprot:4647296-Pyramimonas_sp.AAC.1